MCIIPKPAFYVNLITYTIGGTVSLFMPNLWAFTGIRVISAMNGIASWNIGYIWALEYTGPSRRTLVTTVMCVLYGVGMTTLSLVAWLTTTWVEMGLVSTIPFTIMFLYHFFIMESPRWLFSRGKTDEAVAVLRKMVQKQNSKISSQKLEEVLESMLRSDDPPTLPENQPMISYPDEREPIATIEYSKRNSYRNIAPVRKANVLDLFRKTHIRRKTLLLMFCWIANAVVYTSISYNTENFAGNLYLNWALLGLVEAPGCLFILILDKTGRIWPLSGLMILSGVCCLLTAPGQYLSSVLVIIFALIGKFAISVTYGVLYQVAGELLPTVVRGLGIGMGSVVGGMANVVMPYIIYSARTYRMLPMVIIGILALLSGTSAFFLPETLGQYMPETLEDAEIYGKVEWATFKSHFSRIGVKRRNNKKSDL